MARGAVGEGVTLPLGVFRIGSEPDSAAIAKTIRAGVKNGRGLGPLGSTFAISMLP